jgi:hypothetical protein
MQTTINLICKSLKNLNYKAVPSMKSLDKFAHDLNKLHTKNHKKISLYAKVMHKIPFYIKFKINHKVFSFKPNIINKSCRFIFLDSNKIGLVIFVFFYTFL